jgi:DNA-binding NarL/FixJ family response regulator
VFLLNTGKVTDQCVFTPPHAGYRAREGEVIPLGNRAFAKPRILIADDNPAMLETLVSLLARDFEIVGAVDNGRAALEAAVRLQPAVTVLDIAMPTLNGIQAAERIKGNGDCATEIIFLTANNDPDIVEAALATGALGYVLKLRIFLDLIPAIKLALAGRCLVSPTP